MKRLEVRFSEMQHLKISDLNECTLITKSAICRAAMELGLMQIKEIAARDIEQAKSLILMNDAKAKQ